MDIQTAGHTLTGVSKINVILGRNGCGKSTLLKELRDAVQRVDSLGIANYIIPERAGVLSYIANIDQTIRNDPNWSITSRNTNQYAQFKQQTVTRFQVLEVGVHRKMEAVAARGQVPTELFQHYVNQINELLENIVVRPLQNQLGFEMVSRTSEQVIEPGRISSGESELIALAIECLAFAQEVPDGPPSVLLLDEPDVHLHPDLQGRLMGFLKKLVEKVGCMVVIATHSTAILAALADYDGATVAPMKSGQTDLEFESIDVAYRKILPVFGAHPLSSIFVQSPVLLVEGEDDVRIWQQAVRTGQSWLHLYPVGCGSKSEIHDYEVRVIKVSNAIYDNPIAYSLRDRDDDADEEIADEPPLIRMKLSCRTAENLLLCDEVLSHEGTTWDEVRGRIADWISKNPEHVRFAKMKQFADGGFDRKSFDLKEIRNILLGDSLLSTKPWEVLVGQTIGLMKAETAADTTTEGSLANFLGSKLMDTIFRPALEP